MLLITAALAAPPDHFASLIDIDSAGGSGLYGLSVSDDPAVVTGVVGNRVFAMDLNTWEAVVASPCSVRSAVPAPAAEGIAEVWVGCADGTVQLLGFDGTSLETIVDPIDVDDDYDEPIEALFYGGNSAAPMITAVATGDFLGSVFRIDVDSATVDVNYYQPITYANIDDATSDPFLGAGYLTHPSGAMTLIDLTAGTVTQWPPFLGSVDDIALGGSLHLWGVDDATDLLYQFDATSGAVLGSYPIADPLEPAAVVTSYAAGDQWLMIAGEGEGIRIHQHNNGAILDLNDPYYDNRQAPISIQDAVEFEGWVLGGGVNGYLGVMSAKPWVEFETASVTTAPDNTVQVSFTLDEDRGGDWDLVIDGTRDGTGEVVVSGSGDAGETITAELPVGSDLSEGEHSLFVFLESGGEVGHDSITLTVDAVPDAPLFTYDNLKFLDEGLRIVFDAPSEDEDLGAYIVYVSTEPFSAGDYTDNGATVASSAEAASYGPPTLVAGDHPRIIEVTAGEPIDETIDGLTNGTTYYVGVRARDTGNKVSAMSNVLEETPRESFSAAERAGERGGSACSTGGGPVGWLTLSLAGVLWRRRRGLAVAGAALLVANTASAADGFLGDSEDQTKQYGNFEIRAGGYLNLADANITDAYGDGGHTMFQVEAGPQITRFFEVDLEVGLYRKKGFQTDDQGELSGEVTRLTQIPLGLAASARLQILDEQIIVPYGKFGFDYVLFVENREAPDGLRDNTTGSKIGYHYALGAGILLDIFAPARASLLEAQTGINDTYLTVEWRRQSIDGRKVPWGAPVTDDGFQFSGTLLTVGIKLDY